jgi:hypothetical protein
VFFVRCFIQYSDGEQKIYKILKKEMNSTLLAV